MKKVLTVLLLLASFTTLADTSCQEVYDRIQTGKHNTDMLWQELSLQRLDLLSYNPDQQETVEYIERATAYNSLLENYNAIVANHNQMIEQYQRMCE